MTRLLFIMLTGLLFSCSSSDTHQKEVKDFFAQIDDSTFIRDNFLLLDSIPHEAWKNVFTAYAAADSVLPKQEADFIAGQMDDTETAVWNNTIFDSARIVSKKYIDSASKHTQYNERPHYYTFSRPYFSEHGDFCVLFYNYYIGAHCVETSLRLYKKEHRRWTFVKNYFSMVS